MSSYISCPALWGSPGDTTTTISWAEALQYQGDKHSTHALANWLDEVIYSMTKFLSYYWPGQKLGKNWTACSHDMSNLFSRLESSE